MKTGDLCFRLQYANTLENVANQGISAFYNGSIAKSIVKKVQSLGGILTLRDLEDYRPTFRRPIVGSYRGHRVSVPSAPSSGPVLLSMLNIADNFDLGTDINSSNSHLLVEAIKFGTAQKTVLGDPSFSDAGLIGDINVCIHYLVSVLFYSNY